MVAAYQNQMSVLRKNKSRVCFPHRRNLNALADERERLERERLVMGRRKEAIGGRATGVVSTVQGSWSSCDLFSEAEQLLLLAPPHIKAQDVWEEGIVIGGN